MNKALCILFFILCLLQIAVAQNPFITNYTIEDGLPSNKVFCAFQDSKGFMWFGTDAGVMRFDGNQFIHFTEEDGLSGNVVVRIKEDSKGQIWFLNLNGTLNYFYNDIIFNKQNASFLAELKTNFFFHSFFEDTDSTLYFYNQASEIYVVKNNEYVDYQKYNKSSSNIPVSTHFLNKGSTDHFQVWTNEGILELKDINHLIEQHNTVGIIQKAFSIGKNKTIVLDQFGDVHLFQDTKLIKKNIFHSESQNINDIIIDNEGIMWVSTFDKGIYCYKNYKLIFHLALRMSQNLILDEENNIWTASNIDGIYKINRDILKYGFIDKEEFDNKGVTDLSKANNKGIWATNGQSLFWINKQKLFNKKLSVGGHILESIHQMKNNTIILSGSNTNVHFIEDLKVNKQKDIFERGKLKRLMYNVKKVAIDSSENYFYSFTKDRLIIADINNGMQTSFLPLGIGRINNLFFNNKNQLVVKGAIFVIYDEDSIITNSIYQQFKDQIITSQISLNQQNEILNIYGNNLYLIDNKQTYNLTKNLKSQIDYRIKGMDYYDNTLFFFTAKSVYFISDPLDYIERGEIELNRLKIEFNNINDIICNDSLLYVASDDGLTFIPIKECTNSQLQPTLPYFTKVSLDDKNYNLSSKMVEFKSQKRMSIDFSSLNYSSIPSEYSYKMRGIDESWSSGRETRVVYLNLKPGEYAFQLKSRKNTEPYSDTIELPIKVNPTLFQRTSTKVILLLLTLLIILFIARAIYQRKIKQKETDHLLITLEHKALQSMMNPHFIFNALGSIQGFLLQNKSSEAGTYLSQFARLIRQNMNSLKSNFINIDDEIERLQNYIELERLRMNNRFNFEIIIDDSIDSYDICIPSMVVQPFVENAIWHGIASLNDGGEIKIYFNSIDDKSIEVLVEDNGVGIKNSDTFSKSGKGLNMGVSLTKKRLKLIGERRGVQSNVYSRNLHPYNELPGTQIRIIVPTVEEEES